MSAVARALAAGGVRVSGSDTKSSRITRALEAEGMHVTIGHDRAAVHGADRVVYSSAVSSDNVELVEAERLGIRRAHRAEALGWLVAAHEHAIGVYGTHGKGTVAAMIAWIFERDGLAPGFAIGGILRNFETNARLGSRAWMVAEVDESDGTHTHVRPTAAVLNNLELDHLNFYRDIVDLERKVGDAFEANDRLERLVFGADCETACAVARRVRVERWSFGRTREARVSAASVTPVGEGSRFELVLEGARAASIALRVPGEHNVLNALAAAAAAVSCGLEISVVSEALGTFTGLENRCTTIESRELRAVKDYVSHPTGMRHVLDALSRDARPITVVFKPYRYTLLHYLGAEYPRALGRARRVVLTDLDDAGEPPIAGVNADALADSLRSAGLDVVRVQRCEDAMARLEEERGPRQVVFFGGEDLFALADAWLEARTAEV